MDYIDTIDNIFSNVYNKLNDRPEIQLEMEQIKQSILYILVNKNKSTMNLFDSIKPINYDIIHN